MSGPAELEKAILEIASRRAQALIVRGDPLFISNGEQIAHLAEANVLPTISEERVFSEAGMLISYGPLVAPLTRRTAVLVDRILNGANPGDLPIEQPTKFELVINLKTAKALGITIPPSLLQRADQVIE